MQAQSPMQGQQGQTPGLTRRGRPLCAPSPLKSLVLDAVILLLVVSVFCILFIGGVLAVGNRKMDFVMILAAGMAGTIGPIRSQSKQKKLGQKVTAHKGLVCLNCAYVLEGLHDRRTCPECGVTFEPGQLRQAWKMWLIRNSLPGGPELTRGQPADS